MLEPSDSSLLVLNNLLPGSYSFAVTVRDGDDRNASDDVNVTVLEENPSIRPHNLFSPDNDNFNPTWMIDGAELLTDCEVNVYNRQGQKVYASIGYPTPWDGVHNGKPVPDGAYIYVIRCGGKITKSGTVTIARIK